MRIDVETVIVPIIESLPVTGKYNDDMKCIRGFMHDHMFTEDTQQWICLDSEAEFIINGYIKDRFNLTSKQCDTIMRYFKEHAPRPKKEAKAKPNKLRTQRKGAKLRDELIHGLEEGNVDCDILQELIELDPENIDADEREFSNEILQRAEEEAEHILSNGNPIQYIKNNIAKIHVGDEDTIEGLCISTAGQSILNTDGIQIAVNGESGSGKSHGAKCFLHHVPKKWKRSTSLSSKALFYMDLRPGMIIFSDDTDMDPDLAAIFKQSTTNYQETTYRTTVKDQKKYTVSIPARTNLVLTCVESHVSDQVLNRQLVFETDTSEKQKFSIYQKQKEIEKLKITKLTVTFETLVCRQIFAKMKEQKYNVAIPFADYIEVADYSNSRIQPLLFDMIRGYAMFNYKQRQLDEDGWLVATKDDFYAAKKLFKSREANTVTKLTTPEHEIVKYIVKHQKSTGCSGNDIATGTGIRYTTVHRLINGRKDRPDDDGGLLSKVKGMTKERTSLTQYIREDGELIESQGKQHDVYKIIDYNPWNLFESDFITLHDDMCRGALTWYVKNLKIIHHAGKMRTCSIESIRSLLIIQNMVTSRLNVKSFINSLVKMTLLTIRTSTTALPS